MEQVQPLHPKKPLQTGTSSLLNYQGLSGHLPPCLGCCMSLLFQLQPGYTSVRLHHEQSLLEELSTQINPRSKVGFPAWMEGKTLSVLLLPKDAPGCFAAP